MEERYKRGKRKALHLISPPIYQRKEEDSLYLQFSDSQEVQKRSLFSRPKCPPSFLFALALGAFAQSRERKTQPHSFLPAALTSNPHFPRIGGGGGGGRKGKMVRGAAWESYHRVREAKALCAQNGIHHY